MTVSFRTKRFDTSIEPDVGFNGKDLALWLSDELKGWEARVFEEDWGWALIVERAGCRFLVGVYDYETNDENEYGAKWIIKCSEEVRLLRRLSFAFGGTKPELDVESVIKEIGRILRSDGEIHDVENTLEP
ncbi:MAG TPA: hypothetical protein PKJ19_08335 [Flavobacteriales bacterium]|nr:hypothetical protein [Flavobacteriales bacterium]HNU57569.1 hypothetical protein [Flavobacteriales bacterium]